MPAKRIPLFKTRVRNHQQPCNVLRVLCEQGFKQLQNQKDTPVDIKYIEIPTKATRNLKMSYHNSNNDQELDRYQGTVRIVGNPLILIVKCGKSLENREEPPLFSLIFSNSNVSRTWKTKKKHLAKMVWSS